MATMASQPRLSSELLLKSREVAEVRLSQAGIAAAVKNRTTFYRDVERLVQECEDAAKSLARQEGQRLGARKLAWPWSLIFTDGIWLEEVMAMFAEENGPVPVLLCHELRETHLISGRIHASLIVNDWHGDVQYLKPKLFKSLRQGKYDESRSEMTLKIKDLTIKLQLSDTMYCREEIRLNDPRKIFQHDDKMYFTHAVYYGDPTIHRVELEGVRATTHEWGSEVAGRSYAIRTRFSNGQGLWRCVETIGWLPEHCLDTVA